MKRDEMLSYTAEDISKMNKEELLELARAEQKAIKDARYRLQNAEINSPALRQIQEVGNISAKKSMTVNQLRHEVTKGRMGNGFWRCSPAAGPLVRNVHKQIRCHFW